MHGARELRERIRLEGTVRAVAALLRLSESEVSRLARDKRRPSLTMAFRMEDRLGIPARSWLNGKARKNGSR